MMKAGKILLILVGLHFFSYAVISAQPQTCPAENLGECGDSDGWEGEFFPGIPTIKYEGPSSKNHLAFKYYNAEEEILGKKMKDWFRFSVAFYTLSVEQVVIHLVHKPNIGRGKMVPIH